MKVLLLFAACSLQACTTLDRLSRNPVQDYAAAQSRQIWLDGIKTGEEAQKRSLALIKKGAMNPWDRLEVQAYRDYMDSKYGTTTDKNGKTRLLTDVMDDIPESRN